MAVVRTPRHRPAVPGLRGGRPQPVLELRGRRDQHGHPHRRVERRHRRLRRADARALHDALRRPRRHRRRARHLRRPVLGVAAQHHPPPAAPGRSRARVGRRLARLVRRRHPPRPLPRRRGRRGGPLRRAGRPRRASSAPTGCSGSAPQQEMVEELAGVVGRRAPADHGGPARRPDVPPRRHRRRLRHRRQAGDLRGGGAGAQGARHAREERRARAGSLGVEPALLQGDQLGRLQRLRRRGGRRRPPARHPALPRPRAGRSHRPHRDAHPHLRPDATGRTPSPPSPTRGAAAPSRSPSTRSARSERRGDPRLRLCHADGDAPARQAARPREGRGRRASRCAPARSTGEPVVGFVTGMGPDLATEGIDRLLAAVQPGARRRVRHHRRRRERDADRRRGDARPA